jgi:hypothetical protein
MSTPFSAATAKKNARHRSVDHDADSIDATGSADAPAFGPLGVEKLSVAE